MMLTVSRLVPFAQVRLSKTPWLEHQDRKPVPGSRALGLVSR
jgi:hypothetical protein